MTATIVNSITVTEAANQLGLEEPEFRKLLKGLYKNPGTVKKISLDNYRLIGETLKTSAETETTPEIETETTLELEAAAEGETTPEHDTTTLATTDPQALDIPQARAIAQLNINLNLSNQILDFNKISSALAIIAGEQAVKNFEEIYTHTFNTGVDRVLENFAHRTYDTIQQLREVDNSDFLEQKGRNINPVDTQTAIALVSQFL